MIAAAETVLYWIAAALGVYGALAIAFLALCAIAALFSVIIEREPAGEEMVNPRLAAMTVEQRYQWANRLGPYA